MESVCPVQDTSSTIVHRCHSGCNMKSVYLRARERSINFRLQQPAVEQQPSAASIAFQTEKFDAG